MKPYPYTHCYRDRHGKVRCYYRRHGKQTPIPHEPGTAEFQQAYDALRNPPHVEAASQTTLPRPKSGTWRWLCSRYFAESLAFGELDPETQRVRRRILEATCLEPWERGSSKVFGDAPLAALTPQAIAVLRDRKKGLPEAARGRLKAISRVFGWAMLPESKIAGVTSKPVKVVQRPKESTDGGYHSWAPEEVSQFEERHPVGTKARLALALFLFTGQRKSDVVMFGRQHVKAGVLTFTHGAVIAAHNGATPNQRMAIFGWRTLKEAERYTKAAEQKRIAAGAMPLCSQVKAGTSVANLSRTSG